MAKTLIYYAHPGQRHSQANQEMFRAAEQLDGISCIDLYATYPRFDINIDREQQRLLEHDVVIFQFPLFWYSTPSLLKELIDLVLEHGFAYGHGGDKLKGKKLLVATTTAGPADAYTTEGYQKYPIRTFLTPLERTAGLCHMEFVAPYVLYGALRASYEDGLLPHVKGYETLLSALRDDRFDFDAARSQDVLRCDVLPVREEV